MSPFLRAPVRLLACAVIPVSIFVSIFLAAGTAAADTASGPPIPSPTTPAVSLLPGVLPNVPLPPIPVIDGVTSTVNGVGNTVRTSLAGLTPAADAPRPPSVTPRRTTPRASTADGRPHRAGSHRRSGPTASASRPTRPRAVAHRPATARQAGSGGGAVRTVVLTGPEHALTRPVTIVQNAVDSVLRPGRTELVIVALTALGAVGMLIGVASLGRRTRRSG